MQYTNIKHLMRGRYTMRFRFVFILILITLLASVALHPSSTPNPSQAQSAPPETVLGTNLHAIVDWSPMWVFVDIFKIAREWIPQREGLGWGEGGSLNLTPEGWIASLEEGQYANTVMYADSFNEHYGTYVYPAGNYTLFYEGEGDLEIWNTFIVSQEPGKIVLAIDPPVTQDIFLQINATNPDNPIRNIRLIMPGFEDTYEAQPFHPLFLERLQPYDTIRFMDWMRTNETPVKTWDDRAKLTDAVQSTSRGVAPEYMVLLGNTLHKNIWLNIPHAADDEYVRQLAILVRDTLDPDLKIYLEYSNETWNSIFPQFQYTIDQGLALGLSDNEFQAGLFYHSQRAVEIFQIWQDVFGGTDRLVRVLAAQAGNAWTSEQVVTWQNAYEHADALAIAPYFSCPNLGDPELVEQTLQMTVDEVLDAELDHINDCALTMMTDNKAVADQYGLDLIAYEGGQHLVGIWEAQSNEDLTNLFIAANRHPRMRDLYNTYLQNWHDLGGGLFVNFSDGGHYSRYGSWGVLEYQNQDLNTAPKYLALMDYLALVAPDRVSQ